MSDYFSHDIKLQPGTRARAEDVNDRFDGVVQGFDKLPTPHGTMKGFAGPVAVGDATGLAHAAPVGQVVDGRLFYAQDTGTVNSHIVDLVIAPAAYTVGMQVAFKALHGNTGAATLNLNGLGQKQLVRANGSQLSSGDYLAGAIVTAVYDGSKFVVTSYLPGQETEIKAQRDTVVQAAADAISAKNAVVIAKDESEAAQTGSQIARAAAEAANINAQSAKEAAEAAQAGAETARTGAETARTGAQTARAGAESAKVAAETARADTLAIYGSTTAVQNAVSTAQDSASTATSAKNLAAEWAGKGEDLAVTGFPGKYSAKHHAIKASALKAGAEAAKVGADTAKTAAQTAKSAAETARDGAETAKVASEAARDKSQKWADEQKGVPVEPGKYSAKHWAEKAAEMVFAGGLETVNVTPPLTVDKSDVNAPEIGFSGTKADVGLDNVDNTSDQDKPISTATQAALNGKANTAHRHDEVYELKNANIQEHISSTGNTHNLTLAQLGAAAATHGHTSLLNLVATGSLTDDPNKFTEGLRLTNHSNGPLGTNSEYFYILTFFYNTQGSAANRSQLAIGYRGSKLYTRNWFSADGWSAWVSCHNSAVLGEIQPVLATKADKDETEAAISSISRSMVPVGTIIPYMGGYFSDSGNAGFTSVWGNDAASLNARFNEDGWYVCDGAMLNLPGSPFFDGVNRYLPNLTDDRFVMGSTSAGGVGGSNTISHTHTIAHTHTMAHVHWVNAHTLAEWQMPYHSHTQHNETWANVPGSSYRTARTSGNWCNSISHGGRAHIATYPTGSSGAHDHGNTGGASTSTTSAASAASSGAVSLENRPKFVSCLYLMKVV